MIYLVFVVDYRPSLPYRIAPENATSQQQDDRSSPSSLRATYKSSEQSEGNGNVDGNMKTCTWYLVYSWQ